MAKSQETFNKKEKEKKRLKKRQDKAAKAEERRANSEGGGLDTMMAYLDEFGNIVDTPPDPTIKKKVIKASSIEIGVPKRVDAPVEKVKTGRVEFFNDQKGFGFIKEFKEGDKVTFELEQGMKGMNCVQVKKA